MKEFKLSVCILFVAVAAFACQSGDTAKSFFIKTDSLLIGDSISYVPDTVKALPAEKKAVWGFRMEIEGDFDGDGDKEQLTEHYVSQLDFKETNKFYEFRGNMELWESYELRKLKKPYSYLLCSDPKTDTLRIGTGDQLMGLRFLKNEGDLNDDGNDELSYIIHGADMSSMSTWYIMSYRKGIWKELYSFTMWDWQLPEINDLTQGNPAIRETFSLVKKMGTQKIQVIYNNEGDEDSMIVKLD